jgi:two-component system cell cycle sensor histidine kinase/response regulator CckA
MKDLDVPKKTWKARFNSLFFKGQGLTFDNMDEGWIRAILNSTYDAFVMINSEGRITAWNPQAEKTFGWKREEVLGTTLQQTIIPQRFRQAHQNGMKHYLATGEGPVLNKRIEIDACHRDGHEIPVELTIFPIRIEDQLVFGSFLHDISERKRTESLQKAQLFVTNALTDATTLDQAIPRLLEGICKDLLWSVGEFWIIDPQLDVLKCTHIWTTGDQSLQSFETRTLSLDFKKGEGLPGRVWLTGQAT